MEATGIRRSASTCCFISRRVRLVANLRVWLNPSGTITNLISTSDDEDAAPAASAEGSVMRERAAPPQKKDAVATTTVWSQLRDEPSLRVAPSSRSTFTRGAEVTHPPNLAMCAASDHLGPRGRQWRHPHDDGSAAHARLAGAHAHTHTRTHARTHAHANTHTLSSENMCTSCTQIKPEARQRGAVDLSTFYMLRATHQYTAIGSHRRRDWPADL